MTARVRSAIIIVLSYQSIAVAAVIASMLLLLLLAVRCLYSV